MAGPTLQSNHNVIFQCVFHVVWSPKYGRSVHIPPVDARLRTIQVDVVHEQVVRLQALDRPDHFHLLVDVDPEFGVRRLVKAPKGHSSRVLRQEFPHLRHRQLTLCVATSGGAPLATSKRHFENQKRV